MRGALNSLDPTDGRTLRRFKAMRRVQEVALDLFEARGFSAVTIEQIAAAAEVGPATVYRNFGSKERIVLWDDFDPQLFREVAARLPGTRPARAVVDAMIATLGPIYAAERSRILRRSRLVLGVPELRAAAAGDMRVLREGLAELFVARRAARAGLEASVVAAAVTGTLEMAIVEWVRVRGRTALAVLLRRAFQHLGTAVG